MENSQSITDILNQCDDIIASKDQSRIATHIENFSNVLKQNNLTSPLRLHAVFFLSNLYSA